MLNQAFRLILAISSAYVACLAYFNVIIGDFSLKVNVSLMTTAILLVLQIIILGCLYHFKSGMTKASITIEILLVISLIISMITFHYLIFQLIFGLLITGLSIGLIHEK